MTDQDKADWIAALQRAALPESEIVSFARVFPDQATVSYRLLCCTASGEMIGDDRDYDLLKAVITPLERLADSISGPFTLNYRVSSQTLNLHEG